MIPEVDGKLFDGTTQGNILRAFTMYFIPRISLECICFYNACHYHALFICIFKMFLWGGTPHTPPTYLKCVIKVCIVKEYTWYNHVVKMCDEGTVW